MLERRFGQTVTAVRVGSLGRARSARVRRARPAVGQLRSAIDDDGVRRLRTGSAAAARWSRSPRRRAGRRARRSACSTRDRAARRQARRRATSKDKDKDKKELGVGQAVRLRQGDPAGARAAGEHARRAAARHARHRALAASGTDGEIQAMVEGQRVFTPLKLDKGTQRRRLRGEGPAGRRRAGLGRSARPARRRRRS